MNETICVLGSSGMLGYGVITTLRKAHVDVIALSRKEFDIAQEPIGNLQPYLSGCSAVINCAGIIKPQIAKTSIEEVLQVNAVFPRNLAMLSKTNGIQCFHVTTDCVYSGKKGNYNEKDCFDADDIYGMTKLAGESIGSMVLRTSIIGEESGQARSLLAWAFNQKGKEVNGFTDHFWNGVTTTYLADIILRILEHDAYKEGLFHIHSPKRVSKYDLLKIINEVYSLNLTVRSKESGNMIDRTMVSLYEYSKRFVTLEIADQIRDMKNLFQNIG